DCRPAQGDGYRTAALAWVAVIQDRLPGWVTVTGPPPWLGWRLQDRRPGWVTVTGPPPWQGGGH
ncbi:hypothetical protein KI387_040833, partial [Taxus chinensis]